MIPLPFSPVTLSLPSAFQSYSSPTQEHLVSGSVSNQVHHNNLHPSYPIAPRRTPASKAQTEKEEAKVKKTTRISTQGNTTTLKHKHIGPQISSQVLIANTYPPSTHTPHHSVLPPIHLSRQEIKSSKQR